MLNQNDFQNRIDYMNIQNRLYQERIRKLKEASKPSRHGYVLKMNDENPDDPYIHLPAVGQSNTLSGLQRDIIWHLEDYIKRAKRGQWEGLIEEFTKEDGQLLGGKVLGLADALEELSDPKMKRKITNLKKKKR